MNLLRKLEQRFTKKFKERSGNAVGFLFFIITNLQKNSLKKCHKFEYQGKHRNVIQHMSIVKITCNL